MSRINVDALHSEDGANSNIELDDSRNVTVKGNLSVDGTIPANKLTGALPAISGASLTGVTDTLSFRNLIINGAMNVAQRATTSTSGAGYKTLDRWGWTAGGSGVDYITQARVALTSSDTGPWEKGFRNCLKITNGNHSGGAAAGNYAFVKYKVEAQDIAQSGWDYTSASSKITLSFWIKSSVAQNFHGNLKSENGTKQNYPFETGSLSANTWTKITKTIPGHANVDVSGTNSDGLSISIRAFTGADFTDAGVSLNTWAAWATGTRVPVATSTWYTTDDATFAITGVQLEVGDTATEFEHRSFADELRRCQRYYYMQEGDTNDYMCTSMAKNGAALYFFFNLPVPMRTYPSITGNASDVRHFSSSSSDDFASSGLVLSHYNTTYYWGNGQTTTVLYYEGANASGGQGGMMQCQENGVKLQFSAEL